LSTKGIHQIQEEYQGLGFDTYTEEVDGYMYAYKNQGLYLSNKFPWSGVKYYQTQLDIFDIHYPDYPTNKFLNFLYRIPRRW
jgi:hypothetical protein